MLPTYVDDKDKKRTGIPRSAVYAVAILLLVVTGFGYMFFYTENVHVNKPTLTREDNRIVANGVNVAPATNANNANVAANTAAQNQQATPADAVNTSINSGNNAIISNNNNNGVNNNNNNNNNVVNNNNNPASATQTEAPTPTQSKKIDCSQVSSINEMPPEKRWYCQREEVVKAFDHAWGNYERVAFGQDELMPVSNKANPNAFINLGMTVIDALDTMWIIWHNTDSHDYTESWNRCVDFVRDKLDLGKNQYVSMFETTIRILGGLLSAYDLSGNQVFLHKAKEMADRLSPAFNTPSGVPRTSINLATGDARNPSWTGNNALLAEVGTIQLEFNRLSDALGDPKYANMANLVYRKLYNSPGKVLVGLYPVYVSVDSGNLVGQQITLGALGDSFYEYELKMWLYSGDGFFRQMYDESIQSIEENLYKKTTEDHLGYLAEYNGRPIDKMDHLACFAAGMFGLGAQGSSAKRHLDIAADLTHTCWQMYARQPTGLAPELVNFPNGQKMANNPSAMHNLLRPETVEALFYLWRLTHDQKYRDWGWEILQSFNKYSRVGYGYSGIRDVTKIPPAYDDVQQSFFIAETLKYLFLLFSPDTVIPLDEWVFNTEAHPVRIKNNPVRKEGYRTTNL